MQSQDLQDFQNANVFDEISSDIEEGGASNSTVQEDLSSQVYKRSIGSKSQMILLLNLFC